MNWHNSLRTRITRRFMHRLRSLLLYMRHPRTPLELAIGTPTEAAVRSDSEFVEETSQKMRQAHSIVREFIKTGFDRAKRRYDARVKAVQFKEGHFVWYFIPKVVKSKKSRWNLGNKGPYRVMKRINLVNYVIQRSPRTEPFVAHVDRLTAYVGEIPACWRHYGDGSTAGLPERQAEGDSTTSAADRESQPPNVAGEVDRPVDRPVGSSGRQDRPVAGQRPARDRPDTKCQRRRQSVELPANRRPPSPAAPAHWRAPTAAESSDSPRAPPNPAGPDLSSGPLSDKRSRPTRRKRPPGWLTDFSCLRISSMEGHRGHFQCIYCAQGFANESNLRRHYVRHHQCGYHSRNGPYELGGEELEARMAAIKRCQWGPRRRRRERQKNRGQQEEVIETGRPHRSVGRSPPARPPGYGGRSPSRHRPATGQRPASDRPGPARTGQ